jgi:hypothetical protein
MKHILIISCLLFGHSLSAQRADSTRVFNEQERNELSSLVQLGFSGGILNNLRKQSLTHLSTEISFGGRLRLLLAPSFYWTPGNSADSMQINYFLAGLAGQHNIHGFLFQGKLMTSLSSGRSAFQLAAGIGIPLSEKAWFRLQYTSQIAEQSSFNGHMMSGGLLFSF